MGEPVWSTGDPEGGLPCRLPCTFGVFFLVFWVQKGSGGSNFDDQGLKWKLNLQSLQFQQKKIFWVTQFFRVLDFLNLAPPGSWGSWDKFFFFLIFFWAQNEPLYKKQLLKKIYISIKFRYGGQKRGPPNPKEGSITFSNWSKFLSNDPHMFPHKLHFLWQFHF